MKPTLKNLKKRPALWLDYNGDLYLSYPNGNVIFYHSAPDGCHGWYSSTFRDHHWLSSNTDIYEFISWI